MVQHPELQGQAQVQALLWFQAKPGLPKPPIFIWQMEQPHGLCEGEKGGPQGLRTGQSLHQVRDKVALTGRGSALKSQVLLCWG